MRNATRRHGVPAVLFTMLLGPAALLTGCEREREPVGQVGQEEVIQPEIEGGQEVEGEVIEREIQPVAGQDIGQPEVQEGQTEVAVRRRTVVRQIQQLNIPTVRVCEEYADLNEMTATQMVALGVPKQAAQSIVQHREQQGPFTSIDQLTQVQGLNPSIVSQLRGTVSVRGATGGTGQ